MTCITDHKFFDCIDCTACTLCIGEYYMVHDSVWERVANRGMLCIGCLEQRLGRTLNGSDFTLCPLNVDNIFKGSARVRARIDIDPGYMLASL